MAEPGQVAVYFAHDGHRGALRFPLPHQRQDIQRQVRVATEAQIAGPVVFGARRHQLADHVDALGHQVTHRMGVVGAYVIALLVPVIQVTAGLEEEFRHGHVCRQPVVGHIPGVGQLGNVAVKPPCKRAHKALFKGGAAFRGKQGQSGDNVQLDFRVVFGALVEGVHKAHRFAQPERQPEGNPLAYPLDHAVYTVICVIGIDSVLLGHFRLLVR